LSPSHTAIASPRLSDVTSHITTATVVAITVIIATTVATNTKAPRSDGHNPGRTTVTCPRDLSARMSTRMPMRIPTRMPTCPRSHSCSNHMDSPSQLASSSLHMHVASAPSSGTMCEPRNLQTLPSSAAEGTTAQCHRL